MSTPDVVSGELEPYLKPEPQSELVINAGDSLNFFIGVPTSSTGNTVSISVQFDGASFIRFNETMFELDIEKNVTTNDDQGPYEIMVTLADG